MHRRFLLLFLILLFSATVFAQVSAPPRDQSQAAVLSDMSRRTGETITLNSLSSQQWYYGSYEFIRNLGCPVAPSSPATSGTWQRFAFTYRGIEYIYMISDNLQVLILCNEASLPTAIPTIPPATATQVPTVVSGDFGNLPTATEALNGSGQSGSGSAATATPYCALAPRLQIGANGKVTPGEPNWLHTQASRNSENIGEIPAEALFVVLAGPICDGASRMNYWQVNYDGLIGWTSEGLNGEYWLEPFTNGFLPENIDAAFVPEWANNLPSESLVALSPKGELLALSSESINLILINTADNSQRGYTPLIGATISQLEFSASGYYLLLGYSDGTVAFGRTQPEYSTLVMLSHEAAVSAVTISHNERIIAVADEAGILSFWSTLAPDAPIRRIDIGAVVGDLEFSADDQLLIIRDRQGQFITALQIP